jgi:hypothetical protein
MFISLKSLCNRKIILIGNISQFFTGILDEKFTLDANGILLKPQSFDEKVRVMVLHHTGHFAVSRFVPSVMRPLLTCSPVVKEHWYYWWRAVTTAYYLRPNKQTLEYMATFRTLDFNPTEGWAIFIHLSCYLLCSLLQQF